MSEKIKKLLGNKNNLLVFVLLGILCLVIAIPVKEETKTTEKNSGGTQDITTNTKHEGSQETSKLIGSEVDDYATFMEEKLEGALSQMAGAGKVKVFITLKASGEKVIEKDEPINRSNTLEEDAEGGSRSINNVEMQENTVFSTSGTSSEPYVIKTTQPEVEGVMVIAEGAGTGTVSRSISEVVQALFGIEAHKIKVVKMKD